ncbi:signal peptidase I [Streptomyces sp. 846.5]|nr:signal peptidase I [Streptomyces sp. 846.5]TDU02662.1 signal peptidase I [Streptomyces sp. 846.5]
MKDERPINLRRLWRRPVKLALTVLCLGVLMIVAGIVLFRVNFHAYALNSGAMSPTLLSGDVVLAESVSSAALRHGDVVLVEPVGWFTTGPIFKRVIGTGGDRIICCISGQVTIDGKPLSEPYAPSASGGMPNYSVTVPAGRVFLLGDNRADSIDSRMFLDQDQGTLPTSAVLARVVWTSRGGFEVGASKAPLVYLAVASFGVLFLVLGLLALPITLIISARRSRAVKDEPLPTKM